MIATIVLISVFTALQLTSSGTAPEKPSANQVRVENAYLKTIRSTTVSARVPGILDSLDVAEGNMVTLGQELGRLGDSSIRLQITRAEIALERARRQTENDIDLRLAEKRSAVAINELERAISSNKSIPNTYPVKEVERLQLVADASLLEIERAQYDHDIHNRDLKLAEIELEQARDMLDKHRIVSPVNGIVVAVDKSRGEWTEPGMSLMQIVQTNKLRVEGFVHATETGAGLQGSPATVSLELSGNSLSVPGVVTFVSPETNSVSGQVRIFLEIDNPANQLRAGLKVEAVINLKK